MRSGQVQSVHLTLSWHKLTIHPKFHARRSCHCRVILPGLRVAYKKNCGFGSLGHNREVLGRFLMFFENNTINVIFVSIHNF